ncbi:MAG: shikimate dehydrogenase [Clostridia bacterium]|nr:shikimate dehydrogenase [Clostridia bacterium]
MLDERIGAKTQRFAVLGESLGHTWSPYIHNSLFRACCRDAIYLPITVPKDRLASAVDVFRSCFDGFNVTIPYKERIIPLLDEVDDAVRACGAVNTVENRSGRLIGHITDGLGMLRAIEEHGVFTGQADVLILGGGGAARVAGYEFLSRGGRVTFAVRDVEKGKRLASELSQTQQDGMHRIAVCPLSAIPEAAHDLLINCTPVGMYPHTQESPVGEHVISRCAAVFDAVYNPRKTQLLLMAKRASIPAIEGLGMLFYQAVEAQKLWFQGDFRADASAQNDIYMELQAQL